MHRTITVLVPTIAITCLLCAWEGCGASSRLNNWEKGQLESRASDDIDGFMDGFGEFSGQIGEASAERSDARYEWADCVVGYAGCQRCYEVAGDADGGTVSMEQVLGEGQTDCSASLTVNDVFFGFTINTWWWDGSWATRPDGLFDVQWNGEQAATLVIEGSQRSDGTYDYDYVMNLATAITDGDGNLSGWSVDFDYNGYLDRDWHVECAKDEAGAISGSITGDGAECTISGQDYDYVVDCE